MILPGAFSELTQWLLGSLVPIAVLALFPSVFTIRPRVITLSVLLWLQLASLTLSILSHKVQVAAPSVAAVFLLACAQGILVSLVAVHPANQFDYRQEPST